MMKAKVIKRLEVIGTDIKNNPVIIGIVAFRSKKDAIEFASWANAMMAADNGYLHDDEINKYLGLAVTTCKIYYFTKNANCSVTKWHKHMHTVTLPIGCDCS